MRVLDLEAMIGLALSPTADVTPVRCAYSWMPKSELNFSFSPFHLPVADATFLAVSTR
jgi:hypothetical protein